MTNEQILDHILDLPDDRRVMIAERLIESLDQETFSDDVAEAWHVEIRRRLDRYLAGEVTGRPWEEVSADIKSGLELEQMLRTRIDEVRSGRAEMLDFDEAMTRLDELQRSRLAKDS